MTTAFEQRLQGAIACVTARLAISSIPYGHLAGQPFGLWCVAISCGNPSLQEMNSIALHSAALAAEMYLTGESAEQYNHRLHAH